MKKLAVALLLGALTVPVTFAAPQTGSTTETKTKKKHSKKKADKKAEPTK